MPDIDILYVTWNRREFTAVSFEQLLANTDWGLVRRLVVWDDYSTDGTLDYLRERFNQGLPVDGRLHVGGFRSPIAIMNRYVQRYDAPLFAKIDNDVVVPPGWLQDMNAVMEDHSELELLGMQAGFTGTPGPDPGRSGGYAQTCGHDYVEAPHIGGVGLMRRDAFTLRDRIPVDGRFGFTHWQEKNEPVIGWITPDLHVTCLDQIPFDPYRSLSEGYIRKGWERKYMHDQPYARDHYGWGWWPPELKEQNDV